MTFSETAETDNEWILSSERSLDRQPKIDERFKILSEDSPQEPIMPRTQSCNNENESKRIGTDKNYDELRRITATTNSRTTENNK